MMALDIKLLNHLLDSYENSSVFRGTNKLNRRIAYAFTKKNLPTYFDESSNSYVDIHAVAKLLEVKGFIQIIWRDGRENHIIEKIVLCLDAVPQIYAYVKRKPLLVQEQEVVGILHQWEKNAPTQGLAYLLAKLRERISAGKSVKEYIDVNDSQGLINLLQAVKAVEENNMECFLREFSIKIFQDSKKFEEIQAKVCKILREAYPELADLNNSDLLAEFQIYHTPSYVYLKGNVVLAKQGVNIDLSVFSEGIGFALGSNDSPEEISLCAKAAGIEKVYTIENLTSFFRFQADNGLVVYLGGYHNNQRRALLRKINDCFPNAQYYHFGDIDAGGFYIYHHLVEKTGLPFKLYKMNLATLQAYQAYAKPLNEHDIKRLEVIRKKTTNVDIRTTIDYMLKKGIKLEQECVV